MDIKLRARLSAYSKISSIEGVNQTLPLVGADDVGAVLGVGNDGNYTLLKSVSNDSVDEMFTYSTYPTPVEKPDIDKLFDITGKPSSVTKDDIDKLFSDGDTTTAIGKEDIDSLFKEQPSGSGVVSMSDIDSLFE
jgi:hypothetical protein